MPVTISTDEKAGAPFDRIDKNADRIIEIEEFATLMIEMDRRCTASELRTCFDMIDSDQDGRITLEEFCAWQARESGPQMRPSAQKADDGAV